jgi:hypothetical protein
VSGRMAVFIHFHVKIIWHDDPPLSETNDLTWLFGYRYFKHQLPNKRFAWLVRIAARARTLRWRTSSCWMSRLYPWVWKPLGASWRGAIRSGVQSVEGEMICSCNSWNYSACDGMCHVCVICFCLHYMYWI